MTGIGERRKERRYIVVGMDASLGGEACPIIDISRSAVRLLKAPSLPSRDRPVDIVLRVQGRKPGTFREFTVNGSFIRETHVDVVFGYEAPTKQWESTLRAHDTFKLTHLVEL